MVGGRSSWVGNCRRVGGTAVRGGNAEVRGITARVARRWQRKRKIRCRGRAHSLVVRAAVVHGGVRAGVSEGRRRWQWQRQLRPVAADVSRRGRSRRGAAGTGSLVVRRRWALATGRRRRAAAAVITWLRLPVRTAAAGEVAPGGWASRRRVVPAPAVPRIPVVLHGRRPKITAGVAVAGRGRPPLIVRRRTVHEGWRKVWILAVWRPAASIRRRWTWASAGVVVRAGIRRRPTIASASSVTLPGPVTAVHRVRYIVVRTLVARQIRGPAEQAANRC